MNGYNLLNYPVILVAIVIQYTWALCILIDATSLNTTGVNILSWFFPRDTLFVLLFTCATSSAASFCFRKRVYICSALLPQQFMLALSGIGALIAILHAQFADGIIRSRAFLLVDQCPILFLFVAHAWTIFLIYTQVTKNDS